MCHISDPITATYSIADGDGVNVSEPGDLTLHLSTPDTPPVSANNSVVVNTTANNVLLIPNIQPSNPPQSGPVSVVAYQPTEIVVQKQTSNTATMVVVSLQINATTSFGTTAQVLLPGEFSANAAPSFTTTGNFQPVLTNLEGNLGAINYTNLPTGFANVVIIDNSGNFTSNTAGLGVVTDFSSGCLNTQTFQSVPCP